MQIFSRTLIKQILEDSLGFIANNFQQMTTLCLPILLATSAVGFGLARFYQSTLNVFFVPFLFNLLIYPIYTGALIQMMLRKARREQPPNGELILAAIRQWGPFFLLKTSMVLLISAASVLIIPGIWLWVRLSFAEFYLVVFGLRPKEAMQKSIASTKPYFGLLILLLLCTYVPIILTNFMVDQLIWTFTQSMFVSIIVNTLWSFLGLSVLVMLFRVFMEAMKKEEQSQLSHPVGK